MPQIIVAADRGAAFGEGAVTLRETVSVADFESQHFAAQLVERLGWAVEDANRVEEDSPSTDEHTNRVEEASPSTEGRANRVEGDSPSTEERAKARAPQHIPDQRRARRISEGPQSQREDRITVQSPA
jgi:hypothetical protein